MENKKLKLTISGKPKKSFKNFDTSKTQGKHSVVIDKPHNRLAKKGSSFRFNKSKFPTKAQVNTNDFEKRKLAEQRATKRLKDDLSAKDKKLKVAGQPKIDLKTFGEGKDLNFEVQLDLLPEIKLQPYCFL